MNRLVLVTGAAGKVGTYLRRELGDAYRLRLTDRRTVDDLAPHEEYLRGDLRSMRDVEAMVDGVDAIVHLGGIPGEDDWRTILENNIEGTYHVFEAARRAGVDRIVFASSNHATGFESTASLITSDRLPRPDSRYGVSKAFGEALGSLYADKYGCRVLCLRIGQAVDEPSDQAARWLSPRDLAQLVRIGLDHPDIRYEVIYGISDNEGAFWDLTRARELGYQPVDGADGAGPRLGDDTPSGTSYVTSEGGGHGRRGRRARIRAVVRRLTGRP